MRKIIKLSVVAVGMLFIAGCSAPKIKITDEKSRETGAVQTNYSQALRNVNGMVAVFHERPVNVYVKPIKDETASGGKLPRAISTIVQSSFNDIGGNVITMSAINTKKLPKNPVYIINGAITEFDLVKASGSGIDGAAQGTYKNQQGTIDAGMDRQDKMTKLAITFNPADVRTGNFVPRASTKNQITVDQKSSGNEFAISILGTGFGLDNALTKAHGVHHSITILVELSVVELLGKLTNYPYWILTGGKVNNDVVSHLSAQFLRDPLNKKIKKVSYLLSLKGANVQTTSMMNSQLKQEIIKYKSAHGMPANEDITRQLYMSLIGAS